jgi:hypothetical protein
MPRRHLLAFPIITLLLASTAVQTLRAQGRAPQGVDPRADEALQKMGRSLASAREFTFESNDTVDQLLDNGQKVQFGKTVTVRVRRPNAMSAVVRGDQEDLDYVYQGNKLTVVNRRQNCYAIQEVPDTIDAMFDFVAEKFGLTAPLSDLMFADPYQTLIARVRSGAYLGLHQVNGTPCHHLAFRQDGIDWQIWIEDSQRAVPRKVVITYKEQPGHPQFIATLDKWDLSPSTETTFELAPPPNAKRIDLTPVAASQPSGRR